MAKTKMTPLPDTDYWRAYQGPSYGLLKWADVDAFWRFLEANPEGWYVFDPDQSAPESCMTSVDFLRFLSEARTLVNSRRERSLSGAIYVDDRAKPQFAKIFDPVNMGSACNVSGIRTMPRWVVSRIRPDDVPKLVETEIKSGFFGRLTGLSVR